MIRTASVAVLWAVNSPPHAADERNEAALRPYVIGNSLTDELRHGDFVKMFEGGGKTVRLARPPVPGAPIGRPWAALKARHRRRRSSGTARRRTTPTRASAAP